MMQPLIRTEQRWLPRAIDIVLTLMAWGGFLWLIYFGITKSLIKSPEMGPGAGPFYTTLITLLEYLAVLLMNGLLLIVWARYNQYRFRVERRKRRPALNQNELASSFSVPTDTIITLEMGRIQTVYHDGNGAIDSTQITLTLQPSLLPAPKPVLLAPLRILPQPVLQQRIGVAYL